MELTVRVTQRKARGEAEKRWSGVREAGLAARERNGDLASMLPFEDSLARRLNVDSIAVRGRAGDRKVDAEISCRGRAAAHQARLTGRAFRMTAVHMDLVNDLDRFDLVEQLGGTEGMLS
ncbi:hypothetical protein AAFG13_36355 [Bradyrhizobium sp. B124]|uniref:hypothetical protein n=1 Tax=Bradyrhizobium sp. B124 TaxID=3140245 RepID=UPI00318403E7